MNYQAISTWSQVISAILFAAVLVWMFRKFLVPAIAVAQQTRNEEIRVAEKRRDQAQSDIVSMRSVLAAAEIDAASIRERANMDALRERGRAVEEAREAGERALRNAHGELARSRLTAREALRTELIDLALGVARREANAKVDRSTNALLVRTFLDRLERGGINGK
ncbi:MAG: hypothetical protein M3Z14_03535 [Candidatus Eremiobacteraeota bacterium]|nr:hypothetical protein [Candidatus Eremiobacteraeota bacterium]